MSRRYTPEQLLRLRASPLINKPDSLPPVEEWMGIQDTNQRRSLPLRGHSEEPSLSSQKRPMVADFPHVTRRSSTAPEDLVLGPPKTSFSSANTRNTLKQTESLEEVPSNKDRFSFHERQAKDKESGEKDLDRRDGRYNGANPRRIGKEELEGWQTARPRRNYDEEAEGRARKPGDREKDRPRWEAKDTKDGKEPEIDNKRLSKDDSRILGRRDGQSRTKFEQPWFRGEKPTESDQRNNKNEPRPQEWRRGVPRAEEWDRDRQGRVEQDPEWMDSTEMEESKQSHTQEDFQRWKERMKAGGTPAEETSNSVEAEAKADTTKPGSSKAEALSSKAILMSTPELDASMEKFFASFTEKPGAVDGKGGDKAPRKGRFAALFSPPAEEPIKEIQPASVPTPSSASEVTSPGPQVVSSNEADQAGFQRILQMLGQRSNNNTPQEQISTKSRTRTPVVANDPQNQMFEQPRSPIADSHRRQFDYSQLESPPRSRPAAGLETLLGPTSPGRDYGPRQTQSSNTDAEFLLRLMQQTSHSPNPMTQQQNQGQSGPRPTPGILQMPESLSRQSNLQKQNMPSLPPYLDKPLMMHNPSRPDQQPPREILQRRPTNGQAPSFFDEPFFNELRQTNQQQQPGGQNRHPQLPLGMQRPPGFDQNPPLPPPGWPNHPQMPPQMQHQHQQGGGLTAPPGIPNPPHRGMNPPPFPPSVQQQIQRQMPPPMGMPGPSQQPPPPQPQHQQQQMPMPPSQQRQRKYTGDNNGLGPGYPLPGMGPPPGFLNGPPPPGFGGPPPPQFAMGPNPGQFDGNPGIPNRILMDMYAGGQRNGGRGGGGGGVGGGGGSGSGGGGMMGGGGF